MVGDDELAGPSEFLAADEFDSSMKPMARMKWMKKRIPPPTTARASGAGRATSRG